MHIQIFQRVLPSGLELSVVPMTFGKGRLHIGVPGDLGYLDSW